MSRRHRPTLYEILHAREQAGEREGVPTVQAGGAPRSPALSAGALLGLGAAVAVLSGAAYLVGYSQGRAAGFEQAGEAGNQSTAITERLPGGGPPRLPESSKPPSGDPGSILPASADAEVRVPGLNYFVLAQVEPERAPAMVDFLRTQGLDAHAARWDTGRFLQVFVLPGFEGGSLKSPQAEALKRSILSAGRGWKATAPGNEDFRSHYARKFVP